MRECGRLGREDKIVSYIDLKKSSPNRDYIPHTRQKQAIKCVGLQILNSINWYANAVFNKISS